MNTHVLPRLGVGFHHGERGFSNRLALDEEPEEEWEMTMKKSKSDSETESPTTPTSGMAESRGTELELGYDSTTYLNPINPKGTGEAI